MEESLSKLSEYASPELKDVQTVKILICYLLYRIGKPVDTEQLYDISVSTEIINYFFYQDALDYLIKNDSIIIDNSNGKKNYVPKSYRDKIVVAALKYFAKLKYESEVKIEYIKLENGYYIHCRCLDLKDDLMDLKLFAPDLRQANLIGERIMLNPTGFYSKILNFALDNQEEEFSADDNTNL